VVPNMKELGWTNEDGNYGHEKAQNITYPWNNQTAKNIFELLLLSRVV